MRQWIPTETRTPAADVADLIGHLGEHGFERALLSTVGRWLPVSSMSIYRVGGHEHPKRYMSCSLDIPDTTRSCWQAYLTGPYQHDRTLEQHQPDPVPGPMLCHIHSDEIPAVHRALVYEPFGMAERVSVVDHSGEGVFAINFYRHQHRARLNDRHLAALDDLARTLLALTHKHIALASDCVHSTNEWAQRLLEICPQLTEREQQVCKRLLQGMTHDGIAQDLDIGLPTVKTYRNRAFARLGIHFKSELFALLANCNA